MNIGIILYSYTGHTLFVAEKLRKKLAADGHTVRLERLEMIGPLPPDAKTVMLKSAPSIDPYDGLVLGSPVRGGLPAAPMIRYLQRLPPLEEKKVACLVTGIFPAGWGRNQTLAYMKGVCETKGATVCRTESVMWYSLARRRHIAQVLERLGACFKE